MPGLANLYLQIMIIAIRAVGPTVDVVRHHYGKDHLHESCGSMGFSSNSDIILSLSAMLELFLTSCHLGVSLVSRVLTRKCKGTHT